MKNIFRNKTILITGGTGSIGSAIVKELLKLNCKTIRVLGSDENGLHNLSLSLSTAYQEHFIDSMMRNKIRYFYGDITDLNRMISATEDVDYVIHAAALKHVPICEYNPFEATKVNVLGTENMVKASFFHKKIKKFILISTDKVVDPTTVLGTTKLLAEKIVLNSNLNKGTRDIKLSVVRFGNVIGTRGSVLPKFIFQLKNHNSLTVTDKFSTRFFGQCHSTKFSADKFDAECLSRSVGHRCYFCTCSAINFGQSRADIYSKRSAGHIIFECIDQYQSQCTHCVVFGTEWYSCCQPVE